MSTSLENITILTDEKMVGKHKFSSPLPSLPFLFKTTLQTIPNCIPYVRTTQDIVQKWHDIVGQKINANRFKVGIVWAGNPNHQNDKNRSIPIHVFKQIFSLKEVTWVNLHVDDKVNDIHTISEEVIDFHDGICDFAETAGLIENMDLIITVDTAVAHLAGAMGKETWLLLSVDPDWRWQTTGQESLWYPTIRIFRQMQIGDWQEVLTRVKGALEVKVKK